MIFFLSKRILIKCLNKYGVEKYDAFDDVGGKLSLRWLCWTKRTQALS